MKFNDEFRINLIECIRRELGNNLKSIVLYGSMARGTATAESDIDIALFVDEMNEDAYENAIVQVSILELQYDSVVSLQMISMDDFDKWGNVLPYYGNIKREGIELWKAA